ncbi:MAG: DUF1611 domain-containing protein [Pseudomonadota bacterium]
MSPGSFMTPPFAIYLGDAKSLSDAKTGAGLAHWRAEECLCEIAGAGCDTTLGLPRKTVAEAAHLGAKSLVIGVAPFGGRLPESWLPDLIEAAGLGVSIVNGLHDRLSRKQDLVDCAAQSGATLIDVRVPPKDLPVGNGIKRSGLRLLTVGTDCAVGKKYSALTITKALQKAGANASFCATGQTGIMISGRGVPLDAVPCDFISGAIEQLSPAGPDNHWDVIEGQGSLFHPAYAGVTLGLLHGAQPDVLVLCHELGRQTIEFHPDYPIPSFKEARDLYLRHARLTNPKAQIAGVCLNTSRVASSEADAACQAISQSFGVPTIDPLRHSAAPIAQRCLEIADAVRTHEAGA